MDRDPPPRDAQPGEVRDKIVRWQDDYPHAQAHIGVVRHAWLGKTDPPIEARLITAMGKAIPRAARLSQLVTLMGDAFATRKNSNLLIYAYVPNDLQNLLVGADR